MNPGLAQMISVMLQFKQLHEQQSEYAQNKDLEERKFAAKESGDQLDSMQKFVSFIKSVPPEARQALIDMTSKGLGADPKALGGVAASFPTDPSTVAARLIEKGAPAVNPTEAASYGTTGHGMGENAADAYKNAFVQSQGFGNQGLFDQYTNRAMTGQSSLGNAVDTAGANLPQQDLTTAARYQMQLGLTPWQIAQNLMQQGQLGVAQQEAGTHGFEANTQRIGVNNQFGLGQQELDLRGAGLYNNGQPHTAEDRIKYLTQLMDALKLLGQPLTPEANQGAIKSVIQTQIQPMLGLDPAFMQYLQQSSSPGGWAAFMRGGH